MSTQLAFMTGFLMAMILCGILGAYALAGRRK